MIFFTNELILIYKCHVKITPEVTWNGVVMSHHGKYISCVKSQRRSRSAFNLCVSSGTLKVCVGYKAVLLCGIVPSTADFSRAHFLLATCYYCCILIRRTQNTPANFQSTSQVRGPYHV